MKYVLVQGSKGYLIKPNVIERRLGKDTSDRIVKIVDEIHSQCKGDAWYSILTDLKAEIRISLKYVSFEVELSVLDYHFEICIADTGISWIGDDMRDGVKSLMFLRKGE
jgi:hypothetical protein